MRYFSVERVLEELAYVRAVGLTEVYFGDGIFTIRKERAARILDYFLDVFVDGGLHVELKLDMLPPELIDRCRELFRQGRLSAGVGLQSVNDETLRSMGRPTKKQLIAKNIEALGVGAQLRWDLIYGLPGDTFGDLLDGLDFIYALAPGAMVICQALQVLPGTEYRASARQLGLVYDPIAPYEVLQSHTFSAIDMQKARALEMLLGEYSTIVPALTMRAVAEPLAFRQLFGERYFDYVDVYGWDDPFAHVHYFGERLRAHVHRVGSPIAELISEAIDFVILQSAAQARAREASWLALPSRVLSLELDGDEPIDVYRFRRYRPPLKGLAGDDGAEATYFALEGNELWALSEADYRSLHAHANETKTNSLDT
jgi:hypothetical protein